MAGASMLTLALILTGAASALILVRAASDVLRPAKGDTRGTARG